MTIQLEALHFAFLFDIGALKRVSPLRSLRKLLTLDVEVHRVLEDTLREDSTKSSSGTRSSTKKITRKILSDRSTWLQRYLLSECLVDIVRNFGKEAGEDVSGFLQVRVSGIMEHCYR